MFASLLDPFFNSHLYIQLSPDKVVVRDVRNRIEVSEEAVMVLLVEGSKRTVWGIGRQAADGSIGAQYIRIRPFAHPRSIVSDFHSAEHLLKYLVAKLLRRSWFRPSPSIVIHPLADVEGGYTQVELRALQELAVTCGAWKADVWVGRRLSDADVLTHKFPTR